MRSVLRSRYLCVFVCLCFSTSLPLVMRGPCRSFPGVLCFLFVVCGGGVIG
ncbi:hypothetical protein F5H01DRAFT_340538, partial [Linnemannia elongata]